jgi:hypothetical protein
MRGFVPTRCRDQTENLSIGGWTCAAHGRSLYPSIERSQMVDRRVDIQSYMVDIALTHYDIAYLDGGREVLLRVLEERHGVTPRDAIRRMCDEEAGRDCDPA